MDEKERRKVKRSWGKRNNRVKRVYEEKRREEMLH